MSFGREKNRYWVAVLYPENMRDNWQNDIGDLLEVPYCYCLHNADKDSKSEHRKDHLHLIIVFSNTTTYNHAMTVFNRLSAEGKQALNACQGVINIRSKYDYLIHDTETCKKQGKELYPKSCRISGNNFDIGNYEQVSLADKSLMCKELCDCIVENGFCNFADFYLYVCSNYDSQYFGIMQSYSGFFERLTKANYQKLYLMPTHNYNDNNDK
ncbi:MAG: Rep family protein [Acutalibacteraceae bacterium]|nr:Rep family protein [Acutalibacteraceae bacterium]